MKARDITYIQIAEHRTLYPSMKMKLSHTAVVQELQYGKNVCRTYQNISEASILRLAKIQEKLANTGRMVWLECPNCKRSLGFVYEYLIQCAGRWTFPDNHVCGHCRKEIEAGTYMPEIEKDF